MKNDVSIAAVVSTYNRLDKLKNALAAFESQEVFPNYLIIVDNGSTDGQTLAFLESWCRKESGFKKFVVHLDENKGASYGFNAGFEKAIELNADWVWVSDDDGYPDKEAFKNANLFLEKNHDDSLAAICGTVITRNSIDFSHRRTYYIDRRNNFRELLSKPSDYEKKCFEINEFSYVGTLIKKEALLDVGLASTDYYIWFIDTEHSIRVSKKYRILCVPGIRICHDTNNKNNVFSWKYYYGVRDILYMVRDHFPKKVLRKRITRHHLHMCKMILLLKFNWAKLYWHALKDFKKGIKGKARNY